MRAWDRLTPAERGALQARMVFSGLDPNDWDAQDLVLERMAAAAEVVA